MHIRAAFLDVLLFAVAAEQDDRYLTLSCQLTCAQDRCDPDVTLDWGTQPGWRSGGSHSTLNPITSNWSTTDVQLSGAAAVCSVSRDGVLMASATWRSANSKCVALRWGAVLSEVAAVVVPNGGDVVSSRSPPGCVVSPAPRPPAVCRPRRTLLPFQEENGERCR